MLYVIYPLISEQTFKLSWPIHCSNNNNTLNFEFVSDEPIVTHLAVTWRSSLLGAGAGDVHADEERQATSVSGACKKSRLHHAVVPLVHQLVQRLTLSHEVGLNTPTTMLHVLTIVLENELIVTVVLNLPWNVQDAVLHCQRCTTVGLLVTRSLENPSMPGNNNK